MAQEYRSGLDAPRGATATLNLRVPLGATRTQQRASYGLTFGYGQTVSTPTLDGRTTTRAVNFADFRFAGGEISNARVASFDLANLDQNWRLNDRMNLAGGKKSIWIIAAVVAAGIAVCVLAECFDGNDDDPTDSD